MSDRTRMLLTEALKLSDDERAELADQIYASLDAASDTDAMADEDFARELDRRHKEYMHDPSVGVPMEEVKRLTKIDWRHASHLPSPGPRRVPAHDRPVQHTGCRRSS